MFFLEIYCDSLFNSQMSKLLENNRFDLILNKYVVQNKSVYIFAIISFLLTPISLYFQVMRFSNLVPF